MAKKKASKKESAHSHTGSHKKTSGKHENTTSHAKSHKKTAKKNQPWYNNILIWQIAALVLLIVLLFFAFGNFERTPRSVPVGDGTVVLVEYSDFNCPFCQQVQPTLRQLQDIYGDSLILEVRQFPVQGPDSQRAAEAAECARDQDALDEYKNLVYENFRQYSADTLKQHAATLGLDTAQFNECLDTGQKAAVVQQHLAEGRAAGVTGTPGFTINGELVQGALPLAEFQRVIDRHLESGTTGTAPTAPPTGASPSDDPEVDMIVITDPTCSVCDPQEVITLTQQEIFPTATVREITKDSDEGQQLIEQLGITTVPAYIFGSEVQNTANFGQVAEALIQSGEYYIINPAAIGQGRLLAEVDASFGHSIGAEDAPVHMIEFSDFTCAFCTRFYKETLSSIKSQYVDEGLVRFTYVHFPVVGGESHALASECAAGQDMFWEYHDATFESPAGTTPQSVAQTIGLDMDAFTQCYDTQEFGAVVEAGQDLGVSVGITGTPGFLVNGILVSGAQPFSVFQEIIEAELQ